MKRVILFSFSLWLVLAFFTSVLAQDVTRISPSNDYNNTKTPFNPEAATVLRWDDGVNFNSIGLTSGGTFKVSARFDATIMTPLAGEELTQIEIYVAFYTPGTIILEVYTQDTPINPGALIYSEDVTGQIVVDSWNLITLATPVPIDGNDLWIGYEVTHPNAGEFPAGTDVGPMVPDGGWIYLDPGPWATIASFGLDYNWNIAGYVEPASGGPAFPELIYYQFNEGSGTTTANLAVPGVGNNPASLTGGTVFTSPGQFGSAILGDFTSNGGVESGWNVDLGTSDWTISMWLEIPSDPSGSAMYLLGDPGAGSFRSFHNGVAGQDNLLLRGPFTEVLVTGIGPAPTVVTFVYDSSVPEIRAYKNGVFDSAVPQTAIDLTGGTGFKVGGYSSSSIMQGKMDEFRFYSRALDSAEVANTWDIQIPVELTSFTASVDDNDVTLNWETASELNNSGFQIERKSTGEYQAIGFVPGFGTTTETKAYTFSDANLNVGTYSYRLKQIDYDGSFEYSDPVEVDIFVPDVYSLNQNYPNPFNPSTKITFTIAANALVTLKVFDVLGQEVMTLINQDLTAGIHTYDFDAAGFNSGVYFYRIEANGIDGTNFTNVKKMILLK